MALLLLFPRAGGALRNWSKSQEGIVEAVIIVLSTLILCACQFKTTEIEFDNSQPQNQKLASSRSRYYIPPTKEELAPPPPPKVHDLSTISLTEPSYGRVIIPDQATLRISKPTKVFFDDFKTGSDAEIVIEPSSDPVRPNTLMIITYTFNGSLKVTGGDSDDPEKPVFYLYVSDPKESQGEVTGDLKNGCFALSKSTWGAACEAIHKKLFDIK